MGARAVVLVLLASACDAGPIKLGEPYALIAVPNASGPWGLWLYDRHGEAINEIGSSFSLEAGEIITRVAATEADGWFDTSDLRPEYPVQRTVFGTAVWSITTHASRFRSSDPTAFCGSSAFASTVTLHST